jgi:U3 small nucleolar RNA-associated protein 10
LARARQHQKSGQYSKTSWRCLHTDKKRQDHAEKLEAYFELLKRVVHAAGRPAAQENVRTTFKLILSGLDARQHLPDEDAPRVEKMVIAAFLELVMKLNETAFRPLFRKLFDWAFAGPFYTSYNRRRG